MGEQVSHAMRLQSLFLNLAENTTRETQSLKSCMVVHGEPQGTDVLQSIGIALGYC